MWLFIGGMIVGAGFATCVILKIINDTIEDKDGWG